MSGGPKHSLPVMWKGDDGQVRSSAIVGASPSDVRAFGGVVVDVCGGCRFFQPQHLSGNKPLLDKFTATLLIDAEWKDKKFVGQPLETLGRCGQNPELATGPMSKGCDQYRPKNGRIP